MITKIEIDGFKSFLGFSMELRPLTVVLGANAAGKSNLLDALALLSALSVDGAERALKTARGHGSDLLHRSSIRDAFEISAHVSNVCISFKSNISRETHLSIYKETFGTHAFPLRRVSTGQFLDVLRADNPSATQSIGTLEEIHTLYSSIQCLDLVPETLRRPSREDAAERLARDGSNLAAALAALEGVDEGEGRTRLDVLQESLARLVPGVRGVEVRYDEEVAEYRLSILTRDGTKLPARLASDGTLRTLALLTALHVPQGGTLCFEEPENGLHPGQLRALIDVLVERTAARSPAMQVIATSHSPVVLAALLEARRAAPDQIGLYFMDTARHIPEGATDPSQTTTVSRARRIGEEGESGRDVVPWREVERYLHTATIEEAP